MFTFNFLYQIFQVTYIVYRMSVVGCSRNSVCSLWYFPVNFLPSAYGSCFLLEDLPPALCRALPPVPPPHHLSSASILFFIDATRSAAQAGCCLFLLLSITSSDSRAAVSLCLPQKQLWWQTLLRGHCSLTGLFRLQTRTFVLSLLMCTGGSEISYLLGTKNN